MGRFGQAQGEVEGELGTLIGIDPENTRAIPVKQELTSLKKRS